MCTGKGRDTMLEGLGGVQFSIGMLEESSSFDSLSPSCSNGKDQIVAIILSVSGIEDVQLAQQVPLDNPRTAITVHCAGPKYSYEKRNGNIVIRIDIDLSQWTAAILTPQHNQNILGP